MYTCSKCRETKDKACFSRNKSRVSGYNTYCKLCMAAYYRENRERLTAHRKSRYYENHNANLEYKAEWRAENVDYMKDYLKEYYLRNRDVSIATATAWKKAHPEKVSISGKRRYAKNKGRQHAHTARRRAYQLNAIPSWSDKNFVDGMYSICSLLNRIRGAGVYSVDHIVPLKSTIVCGLHAHTNLTIMRTVYNKAKNNRHWPDMP